MIPVGVRNSITEIPAQTWVMSRNIQNDSENAVRP